MTSLPSGTIDALKGSPGLLVLVLLQVMTMGIVYYSQQRMQERELALIERCFPTGMEPR